MRRSRHVRVCSPSCRTSVSTTWWGRGPGPTAIPYERTGDENADLSTIAQAIASGLEEVIRKAPEQYHLFSTNWPSDEPDLPPRGRGRPDREPPGPLPAEP